MDGTYLEVEGCLGETLVGLPGGDMDFKTMDGFVDWIHFCGRECKWFGGRGAERTDGFKQFLPSDIDT